MAEFHSAQEVERRFRKVVCSFEPHLKAFWEAMQGVDLSFDKEKNGYLTDAMCETELLGGTLISLKKILRDPAPEPTITQKAIAHGQQIGLIRKESMFPEDKTYGQP